MAEPVPSCRTGPTTGWAQGIDGLPAAPPGWQDPLQVQLPPYSLGLKSRAPTALISLFNYHITRITFNKNILVFLIFYDVTPINCVGKNAEPELQRRCQFLK